MSELKLDELKKFHQIFITENPLMADDEIYYLVIYNADDRKIKEAVPIKSMKFEEFLEKIKLFIAKLGLYSNPTICIDANVKSCRKGIKRFTKRLSKMVNNIQDLSELKYYNKVILRTMLRANVTSYRVYMTDNPDFLKDVQKTIVTYNSGQYYVMTPDKIDADRLNIKRLYLLPVPGVGGTILWR